MMQEDEKLGLYDEDKIISKSIKDKISSETAEHIKQKVRENATALVNSIKEIEQAAKKATEKYVNEREKQTAYLEFIAGAKSDAAIKSEAAKKYWYEQFKTENK